MTLQGEPVRGIRLAFESGEVVDFGAKEGEDVIAEILDTDEGARRLGELGVGMNRGIDRYTDTIIFDEKMAETVHLALGRASDACVARRRVRQRFRGQRRLAHGRERGFTA